MTVAVAVLVAVLACGCAVGRGAVGDAVDHGGSLASEEGQVAFMRATKFEATNIDSDVYLLDVDGSGEERLTDGPGLDGFPAWSPDGDRIVFTSDRDGNWELYVMNADGTRQRRLTHTPEEDEGMPAWSPDGQRIAFVVGPLGGSPTIHAMDADSENRGRLVEGNWPSWSPDGRYVAYTGGSQGSERIYAMNADGSRPRPLTTGRYDSEGAWSPDGARIAFASERDEDGEIYVMNADGTGEKRLTDISGHDHWPPSWSSDGKRIAFTSDGRVGVGDIYAMNADGSGLTRLTDDPDYDGFPAWRPQELSGN